MKSIYIALFVLGTLFNRAQTGLYSKLSSYLSSQTKEVSIDQRLIAINVWSSSDKNSRDLNADFEKAYKVYEFAKLKGGNKGIIVLNINLDNNSVNGVVTLKKDGISKIIAIPSDKSEILKELKGKASGYNIVFDTNGNTVYENLVAGTVYESIHKLITR